MKTKRIGALILCAILGLAVMHPIIAGADTRDELNQAIWQREETASQLYTVQDRINVLESKKGEAMEYLSELNAQLSELNEELGELQLAYREQQLLLDVVNQELEYANIEEERQRKEMGVRIQYMYENTTDAGLLEAIFSAKSFTEFLNRANHFQSLTDYDREMLEAYQKICDEVEDKKLQVMVEKKKVAELAAQSKEKLAQIKELYDATADQVQKFSQEITAEQEAQSQILAELAARENQVRILTERVSAEIAAAEARAREEEQRAAAAQAAAEEAIAQAAEAQQEETAAAETAEEAPAAEEAVAGSSEEPSEETAPDIALGDTNWSGKALTRSAGVVQGPNGKETYYNLDMSGVVNIMRNMGIVEKYWVREDGCKMYGDYIMCAADLSIHPRGSLVESSLGTCIVCDTGSFIYQNPQQLDIAVTW